MEVMEAFSGSLGGAGSSSEQDTLTNDITKKIIRIFRTTKPSVGKLSFLEALSDGFLREFNKFKKRKYKYNG